MANCPRHFDVFKPPKCYFGLYSSFSVTGSKWDKVDLTYRFVSYTPDLPRDTVRQVFQQAFQVIRPTCILIYNCQLKVKKVKERIAVNLTATGRHLPYGITQCYLLPDTSERAPP